MVKVSMPDRLLVGASIPPSHDLPDRFADTLHKQRLMSLWGGDALEPSKYSSIGTAHTRIQLQNIGRLRYELFVERDRKAYEADHDIGMFLEPIDDLSLNIHCTDEERCYSAVRLTRGQDGMADRQLAAILTNCDLVKSPYADCVLLSRLSVRPDLRSRTSILDLMRHTYSVGLRQRVRYALLATRSSLIPMFERFGSETTGRHLQDPVAGRLEILALDLLNRGHLSAVSSPLLCELDAFMSEQAMQIGG